MGRSSGKTYAASSAVNEFADTIYPGGVGIIIGPTVADVRDTMIYGKSGILATAKDTNPVRYNQHTNTLHWDNGSTAYVRTSEQGEEATRGLTVNWAWGDEVLKWKSETVYDNLDRCVREPHPNGTRIILTTTPKRGKEWIKSLEAEPDTIVSVAKTTDNRAIDAGYLAKRERELKIGGKRAAEEILGEWVTGDEKLWTKELIEGWRKTVDADLKSICNSMDRNVLSVDPSKGIGRDESGIVLFGQKASAKGAGVVCIEDFTSGADFMTWTDKVVTTAKLYLRPQDTILIEENNFNGIDELIRKKLKEQGVRVRVSTETSVNSKWYRAQEAFSHCMAGDVNFYGQHELLERQLCEWDPEQKDSPDRGDAFAQGVNFLMGSRGRGIRPAFNVMGLNL